MKIIEHAPEPSEETKINLQNLVNTIADIGNIKGYKGWCWVNGKLQVYIEEESKK